MKAKVVLGKCPRSKGLYGMRIEERNNDWIRTWAFKITESKARNEGYESEKISGSMQPTPEYPGCPYCGSMTVAPCRCGKLFCFPEWNGVSGTAVCPWCGRKGEFIAAEKIVVEGKGI
jgi:hypothetical protein